MVGDVQKDGSCSQEPSDFDARHPTYALRAGFYTLPVLAGASHPTYTLSSYRLPGLRIPVVEEGQDAKATHTGEIVGGAESGGVPFNSPVVKYSYWLNE